MLFTSILFLTLFLPLFLIVYYRKPSNAVALFFSLAFYFWGAPQFLPVVLVAGGFNYFLSLRISRSQEPNHRLLYLMVGVVAHLGLLVYYKYTGFFVEQLNLIMPESSRIPLPAIALPLGISFITFEQISYLMDVYRRDCEPARKLPDYYLFLLFFPHSIAGPIFRWKDLEQQIRARVLSNDQIFEGFIRFIYGLGKKALVANYVAYPADKIFALPMSEVGFTYSWLAVFCYTLQIYFDFSAYSDMAIGIGKMAGFNFKENFQYPYLSRSVTEFWQRWHISLTSWFRSYLYIPLGGNRVSLARHYLNILIVFTVSGFWHGASWNFVIWGVYFGLLIVAERLLNLGTAASKLITFDFRTLFTFVLVMIGWVFFRAVDLSHAGAFLKSMIGLNGDPALISLASAQVLPLRCLIVLAISVVILLLEPWIYRRLAIGHREWRWAFAGMAFFLSIATIANSTYNPFIYFRF